MRLRVEFADSLVAPLLRKSWVSVPAHFHLVSDLYAYLIKSFELSQTEDAICLSLDDHYLPRNQRLFDIVRDNDLIVVAPVVKQAAPTVVQTPNAAMSRPKPPPALKRKAVTSSSDSEDPPPQKRPAPKAEAGNRKNPRLTEFKGTHIKFDNEGSAHVVTDKPVLDLKVKSPSQEFDEKKAGWKTKPFPKRNRREPEVAIKEVYEYDVQQYSPADPSTLTAGQEVLFKTLELSEEKMVPVVSDFKVRVYTARQSELGE